MKTRLTAFLIVCVLVTSLFAMTACNKSGSATAPDPVSPEIAREAEAPEGTVVPSVKDTASQPVDQGSWVPEIIDKDKDNTLGDEAIDDSTKYTYTKDLCLLFAASGGMISSEGTGALYDYATTTANTLMVSTENSSPFPYGTFSCDVKTANDTDSGIVFGLSASSVSFWEGNGTSYYFYFLGRDGTAYLGKTDNGSWYVLKIINYSFNFEDYYNLKVVYRGSKILCYVNNDLVLSYRDTTPLKGARWGLRSGATNVSFKNVALTSDYLY